MGGEDVVAVRCLADAERDSLVLDDGDGQGHGRGGEEPLGPIGIVAAVDVQVPRRCFVRGETRWATTGKDAVQTLTRVG